MNEQKNEQTIYKLISSQARQHEIKFKYSHESESENTFGSRLNCRFTVVESTHLSVFNPFHVFFYVPVVLLAICGKNCGQS